MALPSHNSSVPGINFRVAIYILVVPIVTFYVLSVAGCVSSSTGIPGIYLIQLKQKGDPKFELHIGYFGLCAGSTSNLSCGVTKGKSTDKVLSQFSSNVDSGRAKMIYSSSSKKVFDIALRFQRTTICWIIIVAGICYLLGLAALLTHNIRGKETMRKPDSERTDRVFKAIAVGFVWVSAALVFAAALLTTQLGASLVHWPNGSLLVEVGKALLVLQWLATSFSVVFATGVWHMLRDGAESSGMGKGGFSSSGGLSAF